MVAGRAGTAAAAVHDAGKADANLGRCGAVLSAAQAREIGGLLTRLTNENAAFLKLKDAAVAARDEALNRVTALEVEVEMLQRQLG